MQINPVFNNAPGINISGQQAGQVGLANLTEGDSIACRVIFSGDGTAHLKTADGGLIRARLDGNITLPEGSQVTLTVTEKAGDSITLRIADVNGARVSTTGSAAERPSPLPPALAAVFEQIQAANLPTAAKVELFTKALADFPSLNNQSPAVQQALAMLTTQGGAQPAAQVGLGQMLVELAVLISNLENAQASGQQNTAQQAASAGQAPANTAANTTAGNIAAILLGAIAPDGQQAAMPTVPGANVAANAAAAPDSPQAAVPTTPGTNAAANVGAVAPDGPQNIATPANTPAASVGAGIPDGPQPTAPPTVPGTNAAANPTAASVGAVAPDGPQTAAPQQAPPTEALQTVRQMIGELYPPGSSSEPSPKALSMFIERLFAQVGRTVEQGGEQLQKCARELEVRLNLLREAISQSSLPQREELLGQTNRILQQTEALREARLLCMQLPIQFENQKQTAELYIYRRERRAGQKLDPQNATVLLALNTEHLGRLEALIQTRGKEINFKLEISREEAVPLVREYSQALPRLLQEAGFKLNSSSIGHLQRECNNPQAAEKALTEYRRNFDGKLDFFI